MRDYGIVSPRFWLGDTGKQLRGDKDAQIVAMYLMTSPHSNMIGVFHCPLLYIAEETGLLLKGASKGLRRGIEEGFCEVEEASNTIFVKSMAAWQIGSSLDPKDNRVKSLKREVEKIISIRLRQRFLEVYGRVYHLVSDDWQPQNMEPLRSPLQGCLEPLRSQDQDQDQDQKQDQEQKLEPLPGFVNADAFRMWIEYRRRERKPVKRHSYAALFKKFEKLGDHAAQLAAVEHSTASGYTGLFPEPKPANGNGNGHANGKHHAHTGDAAAMADARARAAAIGFRDPWPQESAAVYLTQVRQEETTPRRVPSSIASLADKMRVGK